MRKTFYLTFLIVFYMIGAVFVFAQRFLQVEGGRLIDLQMESPGS